MAALARLVPVLLACGGWSACALCGAELRGGRASVKLLPPPGLLLAGEEKPGPADGIHDDLMVKALVLDSGDTRVALVLCDLYSVDPPLVAAARKAIGSGVPGFGGSGASAFVLVAATGTRSGPVLAPGSAFRGAVIARIADAVRQAAAALQPVSLAFGWGTDNSTAFYNRFLLKDGTVRSNPGKLNPEVVQPVGEADPDLALLRVDASPGQQPLAIIGSYSLRAAVTGGSRYSADYPGTVAQILSKLYAPELVTLWSTGAGGNVSHVDVHRKAAQAGAAEARRVGMILAGEALKASARAATMTAPPKLLTGRDVVKLQGRAGTANPSLPCPAEAEVSAVGLGDDAAVVSVPGELWSELGSAIRKASPYPNTLLIGSANGWAGILPSRRGYSDATLEWDVRCAAGSGEAIAESATRLLADLKRRTALR